LERDKCIADPPVSFREIGLIGALGHDCMIVTFALSA